MNFQKLLIVIIIGLLVGIISVSADWTAPTATPPTCPSSDAACNTPLNISATSQYKSGALGIGGALHGYSDARFDGNVSIGTAIYKASGQYAYRLTLPNNSNYYEGAGIAYKWDTYPGGSLCIAGVCKTSWPSTGTNYWTLSSNYLYPNSTSYNVGIGTTNPQSKLSVGGDGTSDAVIYGYNSSGNYGIYGEISSGIAGVYGKTSGNYYGVYGYHTTTGGGAGVFGDTNTANSAGVYGNANVSTSYGVEGYGGSSSGGAGVYGRSFYTGVRGSGQSYDFYAAKDWGGSEVAYGQGSSIRWKNNISEITDALAKVLSLRGVYFDWDKAHGGQHDMGFIAEEVGQYVPEVVGYDDPSKKENHYIDQNGQDKVYATGLDYGALTPLLVEAIKGQQKEIIDLKAIVCSDHPNAEICKNKN